MGTREASEIVTVLVCEVVLFMECQTSSIFIAILLSIGGLYFVFFLVPLEVVKLNLFP